MVKLPIDNDEKFCKWLLTDFEYEGETLMLSPGSGFYFSSKLGKQEVRIAYVIGEHKLKKAITCLAEALKVYPGKTN